MQVMVNIDENHVVFAPAKFGFLNPIYVKITKFKAIWHRFDNFYVKEWLENPSKLMKNCLQTCQFHCYWSCRLLTTPSNFLTTTTETSQNFSKKCIDLSIRPLYLNILGLETPCQTWLFHKNFDHLICYCFSCLSWVWVSETEKQWYFGFDSGKNVAN